MKPLLERLKKDFWNENTVKKFILMVAFLFIFFHFQNGITDIIKKYVLSDDDNTFSPILDILVLIVFCIIGYYFYYKLIIKRYLPSSNEYLFLGMLFFVFVYYRYSLNGTFYDLSNLFKTEYFSIKYIDLPITVLLFYFISNSYRYFKPKKSNNENADGSKNQLLNDDPIYSIDNDKLEYSSVVEKLCEILLNENHVKSVSVGLIGPWGNGKSSVINMVEDEIKKSASYSDNEIIAIHFLPYLNHKEDDIINEFFLTLSNELSAYNGKLSDDLINYSQKLTDLYKDPSIANFLENQITNFSKTSAKELYESIDEMLESINKKIIVFVDDLDRLNQNEILQVLKLIRNTANFRNTLFVVAMDKEYVISRLKSSDDLLNTKFIDKFFQLEVYLPEIEIKLLRDYFINELKKPFPSMPDNFDARVNDAFNDSNLLFKDYIKNFRDAKRTVNQIRFDLSLYKEDFSYLNLKDFINFTFFKLKFPKVMKELNDGKMDFLSINTITGIYSLIKIKIEGEKSTENITEIINTQKFNNIDYLNKYEAYSKILNNECLDDLSINCEDKKLLIKTLAHLFGEENEVKEIDSIRYQNNFKMLMQQRIFKNYFKQKEFIYLFITDPINLKSYVDELFDKNKIDQLIERLKYYKSPISNDMHSVISTLLFVYEKYATNNINYFEVLTLIRKFIDDLYEEKKQLQLHIKKDEIKWVKEKIFENENLLISTRLNLLGHVWETKEYSHNWFLEDNYSSRIAQKLYKEYLSQFKTNLWEVSDFSVFRIYHSIKNINSKSINSIFIDFWKNNKIELLCAQSTDLDSNYTNFSFRLTATVIEIFGSRENFVSFVKNHPDKDLPAIKEFLNLYYLLEITGFSNYAIFDFTESKIMHRKIDYSTTYFNRPIYYSSDTNIRQVFFETDYEELLDKIMINNIDFKDVTMAKYTYKNKFYLVVNFAKKEGVNAIVDFTTKLKFNPKILKFDESEIVMPENIFAEEIIFKIKNKYYFKSISIQPKLNSNPPNPPFEAYTKVG